jgi:DNA-binding NtrC family response regulator
MSGRRSMVPIALSISSDPEDHALLEHLLQSAGWHVQTAAKLEDAVFQPHEGVALVLCDQSVSGGCWQDALETTKHLEFPPRLIVTSWFADDLLWAEVLNLGGFDVLMKPFQRDEVLRVTGSAWEHWVADRETSGAPPMSPAAAYA